MFSNKFICKLIVPLIFEQLLAVSVGMVDTFMVSIVGQVAVSGVALVDNINRLIIQIMAAFATVVLLLPVSTLVVMIELEQDTPVLSWKLL